MLKKLSVAAAGSAIATLAAVSGASAVSFSGAGGLVPTTGTSGLFESSITVTDDIIIDDISLDFNDLTHTWSGDLVVDLTYDDGAGTVITAGVFDSVGGPTDFDGDYTFEDGGAVFPGAGNPIPGGIYSPNESFLDAFAGINVAGTWTLSIFDQFGGDSGSLGSWDLNIEAATVDPVSTPEPVSLFALFGIGALGVTSLKRKQKEEK
ncbi:MAG: PEP-CTERM sorting domain-containing protein [Okeania sp. SIO2G4]|uniref:proprotein convertase P-domain-containing protein n=1 Tax=unclassified Okeania TaxID=2634635 RepID=UPI0013BADBA3|nr:MULTISPECIES: proprotein convertase P-domain-containing protein [unclassified Okeania]NEP73897.1 PEP-CTERM sorting domain-containing protein [Okeania sp. SIO2G5]NEP94710.1 PEP-CTERM sorting domain-containing protein [Okeania sp. SIO2F5]NEQ92435.1 PEP-CTERM sorting domain-containing protein [Okeania sp. SIO2G4]